MAEKFAKSRKFLPAKISTLKITIPPSLGLSVVGVQQIDRVVEVVEETLKGHAVRLLGKKKQSGKKIGGAPLNLPKIRKNPLIEIISINTGCLNQVRGDGVSPYRFRCYDENVSQK